jgi:uncharacterized protein (DUF488 family)
VYTIGHSTRPIDAFIALLLANGVRTLVDIRTVPRSRTNPQYNADALAAALADRGIGYVRIAELGGLRSKQRDVPPEVNAYWQNASFHNYADYAMSSPFRDGLARLRSLARESRCAIMCAEALWWRCHRRIVADYLLCGGDTVLHIGGEGRVEPARMTPAAAAAPGGALTYPAADRGSPPTPAGTGALL